MKRLLKPAIFVLLALIGIFGGRKFGEAHQARMLSADSGVIPATPSIAHRSDARHDEDAALTHANSVLLEFTPLPDQPGVFDAIEQLDLRQVRALHTRIKALPRNSYRRGILDTIANRWARLDPAHSADYARKFSLGSDVHDRTGLLNAWAHLAPEAALAEAERSPGSAKAIVLRREALTALAKRDPAGTLARLDSMSDEKERTDLLQECLQTWAATDSRQAAQWIVDHPDRFAIGTDGNEAVSEGIRAIAQQDALLAVDTARKLGEPLTTPALATAIAEWGWQNAVAALDWCMANGVGTAHQQGVVGTGMSRAPEKILQKLSTLGARADRDALISTALQSTDPGHSGRLFPLLSAEAQLESVSIYMKSLASMNTGAGWEFATSQPEGDLRERALYHVIASSALPTGIEEKLQSLPTGRSRDAAYAGLIEQKLTASAADAAARISAIDDPKIREQIATRVYSQWRRQDRETADRWLAETPHLSQETKQRFTR